MKSKSKQLACVASVAAMLMVSSARADAYVWDGDIGSDGIGPITDRPFNIWDAQSLGRYVGWQGDPGTLPGLLDSVRFGSGYASGGTIELRGNQGVGTLIVDNRGGGFASFKDGRASGNISALLVASGQIILDGDPGALQGRIFTVRPSVTLFTNQPMQFSGSLMTVNLDGLVIAPSINVAIGLGGNVYFHGPVTAPTFSVSTGDVFFRNSLTAPFVSIGDGSSRTALFDVENDPSFASKVFTINSNGRLNLGGGDLNATLTLNGGRADDIRDLKSPYITATPALRDGLPVVPILFRSIISEPGRTQIFDCRAAFGTNDALILDDAAVYGILDKRGDGNLVLASGSLANASSMIIREGGIRMENVVNKLATTIQIGEASNIAHLTNTQNNQLVTGSTMTIFPGGTWRLNGYDQAINALTLKGGAIDAAGLLGVRSNLTLNADVTVDGASQSNILAELNLPAPTAFNVADGAAAVDLLIDGAIAGSTFRKTGAGTARLTGVPNGPIGRSNTHLLTLVEQGTLELGKIPGMNAVGGGLTIGVAGNNIANIAIAKWMANAQVPDAQSINIDGGGHAMLNGFTQTLAGVNFLSATGGSQLTTGTGTLTLTNKVSADNSTGTINGNIDLANGPIDFETLQASTVTFSGRATNGTISKTGSGTLIINGLAGNAVLNADAGTIVASNAFFSGMQGSAPVAIQTSAITLNIPGGLGYAYSGSLSGPGALNKTGQGSITYSGSSANTLSGLTTVGLGTLVLSKSSGVKAISGDLGISTGATVDVTGLEQFASGVDIIMSGQLLLHNTTQSLRSLTVNGGVVETGSSASLFLSQGLTVDGGAVTGNPRLTITGNGMDVIDQGFAVVRGTIVGASRVDGVSQLEVDGRGSAISVSELAFANLLQLNSGATVQLLVNQPGEAAPIDVNGGLLVGTPILIPFPTPVIAGMTGAAVIDLSGNAALNNGVYNLIDFSAAAYTQAGYSGSVNPQLSNFTLIPPPSAEGHLQISGSVLQYVEVPEPASMALMALPSAALLGRRRSRNLDSSKVSSSL